MNGQDLKNSILQLAIQGKLVPQDSNDEPASELLVKIRKEKERLVKDGKLKKKDLVTTPISDEDKPFDIPDSWEWCRLGEIVVLLSGQDLTPNRYFDSEKGIPYITGASHFVNGSLKVSRWTDSPTSVSHLGDLLITCKGTVGTMAYNTIGDIHIARQIMAITPILTFLPYVQHYLCNIVPKLEKLAHSIIPGISREVLLSSIIPLPPISEQHRIVAKIEEVMPLVEEYDKAQTKLDNLNSELPEQLKQSVLQEAIMGKLGTQDPNDEPASELLKRIRKEKEKLFKEKKLKKKDLVTTPISDEDKPFEIPESWEWCRLGELVANRDSERIPLSVSVRQQQRNKIYDYYGPGGAFDKVDDFLFDKRLLLIGEDGANLLTKSKPNAFFAEGKYWVNNHVHVLDSYIEDEIILDYISMRINGMSLADYVTGTAQPKMNQENMNSILIPLPPLSEQHRIVEKLDELLPKIDKLRK